VKAVKAQPCFKVVCRFSCGLFSQAHHFLFLHFSNVGCCIFSVLARTSEITQVSETNLDPEVEPNS